MSSFEMKGTKLQTKFTVTFSMSIAFRHDTLCSPPDLHLSKKVISPWNAIPRTKGVPSFPFYQCPNTGDIFCHLCHFQKKLVVAIIS